jgi:hypothetical protein
VTSYAVDQPGDDAVAASAGLLMRHHFLRWPRSTLFIDVGQSIFYGSDEVPPGGTHLNFAFRAGPGFTYQLRERAHLIGGMRYFHLSNARRRGAERNPSINGVEAYLGLMWELR